MLNFSLNEGETMLAIERRQEIMVMIKRDQSVRVHDLAPKFNVTEETIRRDLDKLDKEGKVKKTYGGAVLVNPVSEDPSFSDRLKVNMDSKKSIGMKAATLIKDGETIFIDMSTTALEVIKAVPFNINITVITNSLEAIVTLGKMANIKLISIGGTFDKSNQYMGGTMANRFIEHYYVDKTFFSVKAFSKDRGIMDSKEEIAEIKNRMVKNAREAILVIDHSKFNQGALFNVIDLRDLEMVVTDYKLDDAWKSYMTDHNVLPIMTDGKV